MSSLVQWILFPACFLLLPPLVIGLLRKLKARLQNRIGASVFQPYYNLIKLLGKAETISFTASWLFRSSTALIFVVITMVAALTPWLSFKPPIAGDDVFLVIYFLALVRFLTMLAALDTASPFGAFGASREATLAPLVEPAMVLSLVAVAVPIHTTNLGSVFDFSQTAGDPALWMLAGTGVFLASLVELSRMPVDDPTTHLELTMVHEAMTIENSGRNLALIDFSYALRMTVLLGLSTQCYLHAINLGLQLPEASLALLSIIGILIMSCITALIEATAVKLQWRKVPEFIAYGLTMSMLATLVAIAQGAHL